MPPYHKQRALGPHADNRHDVRGLAVACPDLVAHPIERESQLHRVRPRGAVLHIGAAHGPSFRVCNRKEIHSLAGAHNQCA